VEITEVRIKLMEESEDRLRAFCSITLDNSFVVRDLKIIDGSQGPFVAMPSRKLTQRCHRCGMKNYIRSKFCNNCGARQRDNRHSRSDDTPNKLYADVAHPINQECRDMIQVRVITEYHAELERAKEPGYVSRYDDSYEVSAGEKAGADPNTRERVDAPQSASARPPHSSESREQSRSEPS